METAVIDDGVIDLAIAAECAQKGQDVYLLERSAAIGQEVSSHARRQ